MKKQKKNTKPYKKVSDKRNELLRSVLGRNRNVEGQLNFYKALVSRVREILTNEGVSSYPRFTDAEVTVAIDKLIKSLRSTIQQQQCDIASKGAEIRVLAAQLQNQNEFARLCEGDTSKGYMSYNTTMPSGLGKF